MYLEDTFTARICYQYTAYTWIENCESGLSTTQKRTYSNGLVEYGYSYSHGGTDLQGETVMMDSPFMYLRSGNHDWNGSTWIFTGSYTYDGGNRFYPRYNGEVSLYMNDASVTGLAISDTGVPQGVNIGYNYYSMNVEMNNTTVTGLATLYGSMSSSWNSNYQLDTFEITNNTFVHFNGYTRLNGAIQWSDECMRVQGGEGNIISDNTFIDCGVGMYVGRSSYYNNHASTEMWVRTTSPSRTTCLRTVEKSLTFGSTSTTRYKGPPSAATPTAPPVVTQFRSSAVTPKTS